MIAVGIAKIWRKEDCIYCFFDQNGVAVCLFHEDAPGDCSPGSCPLRGWVKKRGGESHDAGEW